jgi:hypothetical protein
LSFFFFFSFFFLQFFFSSIFIFYAVLNPSWSPMLAKERFARLPDRCVRDLHLYLARGALATWDAIVRSDLEYHDALGNRQVVRPACGRAMFARVALGKFGSAPGPPSVAKLSHVTSKEVIVGPGVFINLIGQKTKNLLFFFFFFFCMIQPHPKCVMDPAAHSGCACLTALLDEPVVGLERGEWVPEATVRDTFLALCGCRRRIFFFFFFFFLIFFFFHTPHFPRCQQPLP